MLVNVVAEVHVYIVMTGCFPMLWILHTSQVLVIRISY